MSHYGHISYFVVCIMYNYEFSVYEKVCFLRDSPQCARTTSFTRFLDYTKRRTTVGRTPLYEWSSRRIDLYVTTHNTHNRQTSMPPVVFEPTISTGERPKTYALDRAATAGTGLLECKKLSITGLEWPRGFQEVKVPRFHDNGTGWW
jgi:hypothetical protein